jgi:hypothetical protein
VPREVEPEAADLPDRIDGRTVVFAPPEDRPHPAYELGARERPADVVVGPELEPQNAVELRILGRQHDDRHFMALFAELAADVRARHPRKHHVKHEEVVVASARGLERARTVGAGFHLVARFA